MPRERPTEPGSPWRDEQVVGAHGCRASAGARGPWRVAACLIGGQLLFLGAMAAADTAAASWPGHLLDPLDRIVGGAAVLAMLWFVARRIDRRAVSEYGFRLDWRWAAQLAGFVGVGFLLVAPGQLLGRAAVLSGAAAAAPPQHGPWVWSVSLAFANALGTGVAEEIIVRAHPLRNLRGTWERSGPGARWTILLLSSVWFAALHVPGDFHSTGHVNGLMLLIRTAGGVVLACLYLRSGQLAAPIGLHAGWDLAVDPAIQAALGASAVPSIPPSGPSFVGISSAAWSAAVIAYYLGFLLLAFVFARSLTSGSFAESATRARSRSVGALEAVGLACAAVATVTFSVAEIQRGRLNLRLFGALEREDVRAARELLHLGADPRTCSDDGTTALHLAAEEGDLDLAAEALRLGAPIDNTDQDGDTPVALAAYNAEVPVLRVLLARGADADRADDDGFTPLMRAAQAGDPDAAALLIRFGADKTRSTPRHITALALAREYGRKHPGTAATRLERVILRAPAPRHGKVIVLRIG